MNNIDFKIPITYSEAKNINIYPSEDFHILLLKEGYGIIDINNNKYHINAPLLLCLKSDDKVYMHTVKKSMVLNILSFSPKFINSNFDMKNIKERKKLSLITSDMDMFWLTPFLKRDKEYKGIITPSTDSKLSVEQTIQKINSEITKRADKYWPCRTRSIFMELLFLIHNLQSNSNTENNIKPLILEDKIIDQVILYINMNYEHPITLSDISAKFALNRTTISQRFQKITGTTIINYLNQVRIQMACTFLKETYLSITEIMYKCGYNTSANFNKKFKEIVGLTPNGFRQNKL